MYRVHEGKKEILLWCNASQGHDPKKREHSTDSEEKSEGRKCAKSSCYDKFTDKMMKMEVIETELRERHADGTLCTEQQLRSWST